MTATTEAEVVQAIAVRRRAGDLDRTIGAHELLAPQLAVDGALRRDVDVDDVVVHRRLGVGQDLAGQLAAARASAARGRRSSSARMWPG